MPNPAAVLRNGCRGRGVLPWPVGLQVGHVGVFGTDDRIAVSSTGETPWRWICLLDITFPKMPANGNRIVGTGVMVGPRIVATAAHCVYNLAYGGKADHIAVIPGCNGNLHPFGQTVATRYRTTAGWVNDHARRPAAVRIHSPYDYAAILLDEPLGQTTGSMLFDPPSGDAVAQLGVNNAGYPVDKPFGTLWRNNNWVGKVTADRLYYRLDTVQGQSGSPVWVFDTQTGARTLVGIHTSHVGTSNSAVRLSDPVRENLLLWRAQSESEAS